MYPEDSACVHCCLSPSIYCCLGCHGLPASCLNCCQETHLHHPFHQIEEWTGRYFAPSWLWKVGVSIDLGHKGLPCPSYQNNPGIQSNDFVHQETVEDFVDEEDDLENYDWVDPGKPKSTSIIGARLMVIVHMNGIH